ncbi:MAG: hypothetical protein JXR19_07855 [Bacteroidia bacterium]
MKLLRNTIISFTLIALLSAFSTSSWMHLGSRKVNFGLDHDRIVVTATKGSFTKLKLNVTGNLNMHRIQVNYANGSSEKLNLRHHFVRGRDSRVLDLKGHKRIIQSVDLWYDTKNSSRRRATIRLYGRH